MSFGSDRLMTVDQLGVNDVADQMKNMHELLVVPGARVHSPSFGHGVVTFVHGDDVHVRTEDAVVIEHVRNIHFLPVQRLDDVLVYVTKADVVVGQSQPPRFCGRVQPGVVCQEDHAGVLVLLSQTQESVWVERARVCAFEITPSRDMVYICP